MVRRPRPGIGAVFVLGISGIIALLAQSGHERRAVVPPVDPGYRRVLLLTGPGGAPVPGAGVELWIRRQWELKPEHLGTSRSMGDGTVRVPEYDLRQGEEAVAIVRPPDLANEAFVLAPQATRLELSPGTGHSGRVVDISGNPIPDARVATPPHPPHSAVTVTDEAGRYRLENLATDSVIRAVTDDHAPVDLGLFLYAREDPEVVFYLVAGRKVTGRVVDSGGSGVPGAVVELDQEAVTRVVADEGGRYMMPGVLSDWEVLLTPRAQGLVGCETWGLPGQRDNRLVLYRPAGIHGRVVDGISGVPVTDFEITGVWVKQEEGVEESELIGYRQLETQTTISGGRFRLSGLVPGVVRIEAAAGPLFGEVLVNVFEGGVHRDVVVPLLPPRWGPPDDHRPAYPLVVKAVGPDDRAPVAGVRIVGREAGQEIHTGGDGTAMLSFPPGRHDIVIGGYFEKHGFEGVEVEIPRDESLEVPIELNVPTRVELLGGWARLGSKLWLHCRGEVVEVEFTGDEIPLFFPHDVPFDLMLKAKAHATVALRRVRAPADGVFRIQLRDTPCVTGRCTGAGGHTLAKVVVEVEENPLDARMETMGDGRFKVGPLEPGPVTVLFYARNVRTRRIEAMVSEEGVDLGDVAMAPPCEVEVLVVDSANRPVEGAVVETAYLVSAKGVTDPEGRVTLPGRNPDEVLRVRAEGFLDAWHEVAIPDEANELSEVVRMDLPATLTVRALDEEGRPVVVDLPADDEALVTGAGEIMYEDLRPGPFEREFTDRKGRKGRLQVVLVEGENPSVTVTLR